MSLTPRVDLRRSLVFSPLGLALLDDFAGRQFNQVDDKGHVLPPIDNLIRGEPIGSVRPRLEIQDDAGTWSDTGIRGLFNASGIFAYPNLGRRGKLPSHEKPRNYRVRLDAQYYRAYNADLWLLPNRGLKPGEVAPPDDWFPFAVTAYNGESDPRDLKAMRGTLRLLPGPNYPFLSFVRILRGVVQGAVSGTAVAGALVEVFEPFDDVTAPGAPSAPTSRALADPDGGRTGTPGDYRVGLRWGDATSTFETTVRATDPKTLKQSTPITIPFPYDLTQPVTITIPTL